MKLKKLQRCSVFLLLLALLTTVLPATAKAEGGSLFVTGYTVTDALGNPASSVTKGSVVTITVSVKDTGTGTSDPTTLDVTKLDDSFTGGSIHVEPTSASGQPLTYRVILSGVQYKGVGQSLKVQIGTPGQPGSYQTMELTVTEAVVYEAPTQTEPPAPPAPDAAPAPMVLVSRSELRDPIEPGQEVKLTVTFKNLSNLRLKSPVVTFTPSESLTISGGSTSFVLDEMTANGSASVKIRVKAADTISSPNQSLGVELKFNYHNNISMVQGSVTDKISISAVGRQSVPQPVVILTRSPLTDPISAGQTVDLTLTFQNAGETKLVTPVVSVTPSEALTILNETSTFVLNDMEPGQSQTVPLQLKASKEITSSNQSISTELKYSYDNGETLTQATASDRVNLSANTTTAPKEEVKTDAPMPNIVIRQYTYGGDSVAAGSKFPLDFTFENTGTLKIENIVVTVDGGENFTMDGSTNTYHYKSLAAGGSLTQNIPMQAVPTGKNGAQSIGVGFKYEYVDHEKRSQATADIKISVPIYQPDRFQINPPTLPESFQMGEESEISLAYVNKGKDDIANVEATLEGDGVETPARTQYLGNITAGSSGNIGFALTPMESGELNLVLKISYENADQQIQTRTFPVTLTAGEMMAEEFPDEGIAEEPSSPALPWLWIALGGGVLAVVVVIVLVKKHRSAKASAASDNWADWDDPQSSGPDAAGGTGGGHDR